MATLQITFVSESAGYRNSFGWYNKRTGEAGIIWADTNDDGHNAPMQAGDTATIEASQADIDAGNIGFFIIPDGASNYGTGPNSPLNGDLSFSINHQGDGVIRDSHGNRLTGEQGQIIFTDASLNKHDRDYTSSHTGTNQSAGDLASDQADGITGRIAFEDLVRHSDRDFNDLVVDVAIVGGNHAPVVDDQSFQVAENSANGTTVGQVVATDPDSGQALSYAIVAGNGNGAFAIDSATGAITVADATRLDHENPALSGYALTVQVTDSGALSDTAAVTIAVTNVNEQPDAIDDTGVASGNVLTNDTDPDQGDVLTVVNEGVQQGTYGALTVAANGAWTYELDSADADTRALAEGEQATETFGYTARDALGLTDSASLSATVTGINDAPEIVAGLSSGGTVDQVVTTDFAGQREDGTALAIQADGKVVVGGWTSVGAGDSSWAVARYNPDGSLDATFGAGGKVVTPIGGPLEQATSVAIQSDGKIVVAGDNYKKAALVRYESDGSLDASFGSGGRLEVAGPDARIERIAIQSDGKIVAAGRAWNGADWDFAVWRANADGTLDTNFGGSGALQFEFGTGNSEAYGLAIQSDGRILIGGFSSNATDTDFTLARLETDGSLDGSFGTGGVVNTAIGAGRDEAFSIAVQADGRILAGGWSHNGTDFDYALARYNDDGSLDTSFGSGGVVVHAVATGANYDVILGVALQSDGRIIAAGESATHASLARYHADGTLDTAFAGDGTLMFSTMGITGASDLALAADGSAVVAGSASGNAGDFALARVIDGAFAGQVQEDLSLSAGGQLSAVDPDNGAVLTWSLVGSGDGSYGTLGLSGSGAWGYELNNLALQVQSLAAGEVATDTFTVRVSDEYSASDEEQLVVRVVGTNDGPVANADTVAGALEDTTLVIPGASLLANDTDPDAADGKSIVAVGGAVNGSVALVGTDVHFMPVAGYSGAASFTYTMSDGALSSTASVTLDVVAVADQPSVLVADASSTGNGAIGLSISVAAGDPDASESIGVVVSGVPAGWTLSAGALDEESGDYTLSPAQLVGLTITPVTDSVGSATLSVRAIATEASNGDAAVAASSLTVTVDQPDTLHGQAIEGYIAGATVFADTDLDGLLDGGEARATTDANGNFALVGGSGPLVMFGGTDVSTGQVFAGVLRAPEGSTVVTPLTTLVAELVDQGQTLAAATGNVAASFGLDMLTVGGNPIDLLSFDPIATAVAGGADGDAAVQVLAAGIQVQNAIAQVGALLDGAGATDSGAAVVSELASLVSAGSPVDLASAVTTESLINAAATTANGVEPADISAVAADAAAVVAAANDEVDQAVAGGSGVAVLEDLAQVAAISQSDAVATDLAQAGGANDPGTIAADYTGSNLQTLVDNAPVGDVNGGLNGTLGDDILIGTAGNDAIDGLPGNDVLDGLGGNDQLFGSDGHDILHGGTGDDAIDGGILADYQSFEGFTDSDRADYAGASSGVNVNLSTGAASDGDGGIDTLSGIEGVNGSSYADTLIGSGAFFEFFRGGAGDDTIDGGAFHDRAEYNDAASGISVDLAAGVVSGDASVGTDTLIGIEHIRGSEFADNYVATGFVGVNSPGGLPSTFNRFDGRGGDDTILGNGNTGIDYFQALEAVNVNLVTGIATGGASTGTDTILGGVAQVRGSPFADNLTGGNAATNNFESFEGRAGDDLISGGSGFDRAVYAFDGAVSVGITVNMAAGTVTGDAALTGTDTLSSIESIQGSFRDDFYDATGFSATSANAGSNGTFSEFEGMAGNDTVVGNGNTRVSYASAREAVSVNLATGIAVGGASVGTDSFSGVTEARGSNFDDTLTGSNNGTAFTQFFEGRGGNDIISGGGGIDQARYSFDFTAAGITVNMTAINAFTGTVTGDVAIGTDTLINIASVRGTNFADTYVATGFNSSVTGLGTFNEFEGGGGNDSITGNGNTRLTFVNATSAVTVDMQAGTASGASTGTDNFTGVNAIRASSLNDTLLGSAGNNSFEGRGGDDSIDGAAGFDTARFDFSATGSGSFVYDAAGVITATVAGLGVDTIVNVENIRGTNFDDVFDATLYGGDNRFEGMGGNDTILGNGRTGLDFVASSAAVTVDLQAGTASGAAIGADVFSGVNFLLGSNSGDSFLGSAGNELFIGRGGNDQIQGGAGNDTLQGDDGNDSIDGGADYDIYQFGTPNGAATISVDAGGTITASAASQGMDMLVNVENVVGTGFADTYDATAATGVTEFEGTGGNDTVLGNGFTRITHWRATSGVTVDLQAGIATGASIGTDSLSGIGTVSGSNFNDDLTGGAGGEMIQANNGNDLIHGSVGVDLIFGGSGIDRMSYASSTSGVVVDLATGTTSNDGLGSFDSLAEIENVTGSAFNDVLIGSSVNNDFDGGGGDDTINGREGFDQVWYVAASGPGSFVWGPAGIITASAGGQGTDSLLEVERVNGTNFNDLFDATSFTGWSEFEGGGGDDTIWGSAVGVTQVFYSSASTAVVVDFQAGTATGASTGNDILINVHRAFGSNFADTFIGSGSDDSFVGGGGNDAIDGAGGHDVVDYSGAFGPGTFNISVTGTITATAGGQDTDTLTNVESVYGTNFADIYNATAFAGANTFEGIGGNDTIVGNGLTRIDHWSASSGVTVDLQAGTASGTSSGTDSLSGVNWASGSTFDDSLTGSVADELFHGNDGNDMIAGGDGNDYLEGGNGVDSLTGGVGFDYLRASGNGTDTFDFNLIGEAGDTVDQFSVGVGGDVFDIADLLDASTSYADGGGGALSDYVQVVASGGDGLLQIDSDGLSAGGWQTLATILGGSALDLNTLLAGGNIDLFN